MKALSIRQPWAWAILHAGKDIENRDWSERNPGLRFRGPFLIHTGETFDQDGYNYLSRVLPSAVLGKMPKVKEFARGGIVGRARIVDILPDHPSSWFFGPLGLVLADAEPLPFIPFKGALGFFDVPDNIARAA